MEFGPFERPEAEAEVTLLAGDIFTKGQFCPWEDAQVFFSRPVMAVPGNHEFYDGAIDTAVPKLKAAAAAKRATVLDNDEAVVAGVRILGSTLWTDFRFFAGDDLVRIKEDANLCFGSRHGAGMNDFWKIRVADDAYRRFRPKDAALLHQVSVAWLRLRLSKPFAGPTAVMTHHAP